MGCRTRKTKKCHPVGPIHSIKSYSKCIWKKTAPNSHRRLCCRHISNCIGDKCVQLKPNCRFIGKTTGSKTQCRYINIRNKQHRRKCCVFTTSCDKTLETGKKCAPTKKRCYWANANHISFSVRKCKWKLNKNGFSKSRICCRTLKVCVPNKGCHKKENVHKLVNQF